jgi:two-component system sensor histidine kinase VicK
MKNWTQYMSKLHQYMSRLQWKLVVIFLLLIIASVQLIGVFIIRLLEDRYNDDFIKDLEIQAQSIEVPLQTILSNNHANDDNRTVTEESKEVDALLKKLTISKDMQIQVLNENGIVLGTTSSNKNQIIGTKNVYANLYNTSSKTIRRDPNTNVDYQIYTRPIKNHNGELIAVVYIEASLQPVYTKISIITKRLIAIAALVLVSSAFLIVLLARTITSPLEEITKKTTEMATGNFDIQVKVYSQDEIGKLATAFNNLSSDLQKALSQKEEEKEKLESVVANMSDGVIATDRNGQIIVKNRWAEKILNRPIQSKKYYRSPILLYCL